MRTSVFLPANMLMLSGVIAAIHLGKVSPAIPTLQDALGLTIVQAGFLLSLMQFAGGAAGVLMGVFSDGIGARRSVLIGQAVLCLSSALAGATSGIPALLALRMLESIGFLMVILPTPGLLRRLVPRERMAFRLGLWGCYVPIGTAAALLLAPALLEVIGWQGWWLVPAIGSLLMIALLFYALPDDRASAPPHLVKTHEFASWSERLRIVLRAPGPWLVGLAFAMYSGQWMAIIGFLPTIYVTAGLTKSAAGYLTALAALGNIAGNFAAAVLNHRGVSKKSILSIGYLFLLVMVVVAFVDATRELPELRYIAILLFSSVGGLIPATLFILAVERAPNDQVVAASVGWVQQLSSLGMLLMPPLFARLAEVAGGWHLTWIAAGLASIIGLWLSSRVVDQT